MSARPDGPIWAEYYKILRESADAGSWSRGVQSARGRNIEWHFLPEEKQIDARVLPHGETLSYSVQLLPADEDWLCNCEGGEDPCVHVLAAAICVHQDLKDGKLSRQPELSERSVPLGRLHYCFSSRPEGLWFERLAVGGDLRLKMAITLDSFVATRARDITLRLTKADYLLDRLLRDDRRGTLRLETMQALLPALANADDILITFDGKEVASHREFIGFEVTISDVDRGVQIVGGPDRRIKSFFKNGAALLADGLYPAGIPKLSAKLLETLRQKRIIPLHELDRFEGELLPELQEKVRLEIKTTRLRQIEDVALRIELRAAPSKMGALIKPVLVYGDPALAEVDGDAMKVLGAVTPRRKRDEERRLKDELWRRCQWELGKEQFYQPEAAIAEIGRLAAWDNKIAPMDKAALRNFRIADHWQMELANSVAGPRLSLRSRATGEEWSDDYGEKALQAHGRGERLLALPEGGWAELPVPWLAENAEIAKAVIEAKDFEGKRGELMRANLSADIAAAGGKNFDILAALKKSERQFFAIAPALEPTLRSYQKEGARWLQERFNYDLGAILADDMGLGKTIQTLSLIRGRVLIIVPTSLLFNWQEEFAKFRPEVKISLFHGPNRKHDAAADVVLTSFAVARIDNQLLAQDDWDLIVLDEAHQIKNPDSQTSLAVRRLQSRAKLALTGTPIENHLSDLWALFDFILPGYLGTVKTFKKRFGSGEARALEKLQKLVAPFVLRRNKGQVAPELPPKTELIHHVVLGDAERQVYDGLLAAALAELQTQQQAAGGLSAANPIFQAILRLRQACCHQGLLPPPAAALSSKLALLMELVTELVDEGHKVLVFSQWTSLLDFVEGKFHEESFKYNRLDGQTRDRAAVVANFQNDPQLKVMLLSLKAGGVGLNLTAADHVIFLDPWWNPMVERQAQDRVHRIGQTKPVFVHRLIAADSIEEKIVSLQQRKAAMAEDILAGRDMALDLADIEALLI